MSLDARLQDRKYRNWVKASLGLDYLKQGLTSFVADQARHLHAAFITSIEQKCNLTNVQCSVCRFKTLLPAHVVKNTQCPHRRDVCSCFKRNKIPCPKRICGELYDTIVGEHNSNNPIWDSTDSLKWTSSPWELAKCYLSSSGYKDKQAADECDASGLLSICINCRTISSIITDISQFEKAREARNEILHSSSFELEDTTLVDHIGVMLAVLSDPNIHPNHDAAGAATNLQELLTDNAIIDNAAETQVREMALVEINNRIIDVQKEVTTLTASDTKRKYELERIEQDLVMNRNKHEDDLKSLTQTTHVLYSRDDATNNRVDDLQTRQHISEKHHNETIERQDATDAHLCATDQRVDDLQTRQHISEKHHDETIERQDATDAHLCATDQRVGDLQTRQHISEKHHSETKERQDATDAHVCTTDQRVNVLEKHKDENQKKIGLAGKFLYKFFNYDRGLQRYLVDIYQRYYLKTDVSPIFPVVEHIDNMFIPIILSWTFKGKSKIIQKEIRKLEELFQSNGNGGQIMFIAADAGMGKQLCVGKLFHHGVKHMTKTSDKHYQKK